MEHCAPLGVKQDISLDGRTRTLGVSIDRIHTEDDSVNATHRNGIPKKNSSREIVTS